MDPQTLATLDQEQALAIFNQTAEQMRFYLNHQWQLTYYTVLAYAALVVALAAAPLGRWRNWVSWFAVVLVVGGAVQAGRTLYYSNDIRLTEHARLVEVMKEEHLPLIHDIYAKHQPTDRPDRPWPVRIFQYALDFLGDDPLPRFPWGLLSVVFLGAIFAILIILSGIPAVQQFFLWLRRGVPRFFTWVSQWVQRVFVWAYHSVPRVLAWLSQGVQRFFAWASHWMPRILAWVSQGVQRVLAWASR